MPQETAQDWTTTTPELITSDPEVTITTVNDGGLRNLAQSVAAHLRGDPTGALLHLETLTSGEDFGDSLFGRAQLRMELHQYELAAADYERLQALRPRDAENYYQRGLCYHYLDRDGKALEQFSQAIEVDPTRSDVLVAQGTCLLRIKELDQALAAFQRALDKSPGVEAALLGQGTALQLSYELDDAQLAYEQVLKVNPNSREALTNLVILGQQKKDDALVREHARRLLALDGDSETALLALSNVSFSSGALEAAVVHCTRLVQLRPEQHDYWYNLGVAEERRGNLDASARAFENAASAEPSSASAYLASAAVYEKMGDNAAARVSLERAVRLAPQRIDLRYHTGMLAERQGLQEEARAIYESVVAEDPKHAGSRFRLGYLRLERQDYAGAAQDFEACLAGRGEWREAEINLALAYSKLNRRDEAQAVLDRLVAREPRAVDGLRGSAAISLAGDSSHSLQSLLKLLNAGDRSPEVLFNAGVLHQQAGEWTQAAACYREALDSNPRFAEALVNLGHALMAGGDEKEALKSWAAAVELAPHLARGYYKKVPD